MRRWGSCRVVVPGSVQRIQAVNVSLGWPGIVGLCDGWCFRCHGAGPEGSQASRVIRRAIDVQRDILRSLFNWRTRRRVYLRVPGRLAECVNISSLCYSLCLPRCLAAAGQSGKWLLQTTRQRGRRLESRFCFSRSTSKIATRPPFSPRCCMFMWKSVAPRMTQTSWPSNSTTRQKWSQTIQQQATTT